MVCCCIVIGLMIISFLENALVSNGNVMNVRFYGQDVSFLVESVVTDHSKSTESVADISLSNRIGNLS